MNQKSVIAILVVIVIILTGTVVYFATISKRKSVTPIQKKVVQQPTSTTQPVANQSVQPKPKTAPDWRIYKNEKYGFELTFSDTWQGYIATNRTLDWGSFGTSDSIDFGFPVQKDGLFNISFHTKQQWKNIQSEDGPKPEFLGENKTYVFAWAPAQYAADSNMEKRMTEIQSIIKTFKIVK